MIGVIGKLSLLMGVSTAVISGFVAPVHAITFSFQSLPLDQSSLSVNSNGITATLSNYNTGDYNDFPGTPSSYENFSTLDQGIVLGAPFPGVPPVLAGVGQNFTISFSQALRITAFTVTAPNDGARIDFYRTNTTNAITGANFLSDNTYNIAPFDVALGEEIIIRATGIDGVPLVEGKEFNFSGLQAEPVPFEGDSLPLFGASILFGGGVWLKRRRQGQLVVLPESDIENES